MGTLPKKWWHYQRHGYPTKGMNTLPQAWWTSGIQNSLLVLSLDLRWHISCVFEQGIQIWGQKCQNRPGLRLNLARKEHKAEFLMIFRDFWTLPDRIDSFTHINLNLCSCLPLVMYIDENQPLFWEDCGRKVDFWAREWAFLTKLTFFRQIGITRKDCQTTHDYFF